MEDLFRPLNIVINILLYIVCLYLRIYIYISRSLINVQKSRSGDKEQAEMENANVILKKVKNNDRE